ncbi:MAG: polysaccharide deacetylase family protein [Anaerolineae bacterium]|nr:polysaccharide deacetylase family protein [Anaerolineae bacterium]
MKTESILFAAKAKGPFALLKRAKAITGRYGLTPTKIDEALNLFAQSLKQFNCGASFPITTVVLNRNSHVIAKYLNQNIEFLVHGLTHIDYAHLPPDQQFIHLRRARQIFSHIGIKPTGFRSPYLRRGEDLYKAIEAAGFSYVSNQPVMWDVLDSDDFTPTTKNNFARALEFYEPWLAEKRPVLPEFRGNLVEIPVSLPDDEILIDRLESEGNGLVAKSWQRILSQTYDRGELFTLQLHPERTAGCREGLNAVLAAARSLTPVVWITRMDELAAWWQARAKVGAELTPIEDEKYQLTIQPLEGATLLARNLSIDGPTTAWSDGYQLVENRSVTFSCPIRPIIGLSPRCAPALADFLRQQGFIVDVSDDGSQYAFYFDLTEFTASQQLSILNQLEQTDRPLIRLGRWPHGAKAALTLTGDIDALTLWEYGLRFIGR